MLDCIIIGAGPAGSTAAYHLAQQGRSVRLLEKAELPRYKACSGAVAPVVAQWFDFDLGPALDCKARHLRYTWKLGDPVEATLKTAEPVWIVQRAVFDQFLVAQAAQAGADVCDRTPATGITPIDGGWQVNTATGSHQARYLIAADGANGPTAGWLGLKFPKPRPAGILEMPEGSSAGEPPQVNFEFGLIKNGCAWQFPRSQGASLGVINLLGSPLKNMESALADYAKGLGLAATSGEMHLGSIKLWDGSQPLHGRHALVVGEAAALVDPLTAEGIRPAIASGVAAATALGDALGGNASALETYTQTMQADWGADFQWAQRIAAVFYRVPGLSYRTGIKRPSATERLGQLMVGELRYADIANRVIKRLSGSLIPGFGK